VRCSTCPRRRNTQSRRGWPRRRRTTLPGGALGSGRYYPPFPIYFEKGFGAKVHDVDGHEYLDYVGSYGAATLGLSHAAVCDAVKAAIEHEGLLVALPHPREVDLARKLCEHIPYADQVTVHAGGGSDAIAHAVRLARAATGRTMLMKFEGGYHGWHDDVAMSARPSPEDAGPYEVPRTVAMSAGIPEDRVRSCVVGHLNDLASTERLIREHRNELAAIIVEPVVHSSGCIRLNVEFLTLLRQMCDDYGIVLVYDEIITGIRHGLGGAGAREGVHPDVAAFGKALGGGFVISALAGKRELMSMFTPSGPVLYSGTFNANLVAVVAAQATITVMEQEPVHEHLFHLGDLLCERINEAIERQGVQAICYNYGSIWCLYFGVDRVENYRDIIDTASTKADALNLSYRAHLLSRGILLLPFFTNRGYISYAHTEEDIEMTAEVTEEFLKEHATVLRRR
jgi:glutamate-1-semialdehyde 2,1-aminomutase